MVDENDSYLTKDGELKFLRKGERVAAKHSHSCNHVVFLKRCTSENVVPKGLRWKVPVKSPQASKIKAKAEKLLLRERLRYWQRRRAMLLGQLMEFKNAVFSRFGYEEASHYWSMILMSKDSVFQRIKAKQKRKFLSLMLVSSKNESFSGYESFADNVINLSSVFLSVEEKKLLGKGLKFVPTHTIIPYEEFIVGVEEIAGKLGSSVAEEIRSDIRGILKDGKVPADNLSKEERRALQTLKKKKREVIISKADKGNCTVIMDKLEYRDKLKAVIDNSGFVELKKDLTDSEGRKLVKLLMECEKNGEMTRSEKLNLTVKTLRCPVLFGLSKQHKPSVPLRPIVFYVDSPTYIVAKELAKILRPIHGSNEFNVKASGEMCAFLHDLSVPDNCIIVSYHVVNLFGSVPAEQAADMAIERLKRDD